MHSQLQEKPDRPLYCAFDFSQAGGELYQKLTRERWIDVENHESALQKLEVEEFAFLEAAQTMYRAYGCRVMDIGPTVFKGNLVIAWKKDFLYAPLLNY